MALFSLGRVSSLPSHLHQVCVVCMICASVEFVAEWSKALLKNGGYARGVVSSLAAATSFPLFVVKSFKPRRGSLSIGSPVQSRWPPFCALLRIWLSDFLLAMALLWLQWAGGGAMRRGGPEPNPHASWCTEHLVSHVLSEP